MKTQTLAALFAITAIAGCANHNPVDQVHFRNEPLVKQVEKGMTVEQVRTIGGPPSSTMQRTVNPGSCNDYVLYNDGNEQTYHVSFGASGLVDGKGFLTCNELERHERKMSH